MLWGPILQHPTAIALMQEALGADHMEMKLKVFRMK
jgi:hypothetical protein